MNRDSFWETFQDIFYLVVKILLVFTLLQVVLMAIGSDIQLPLIHGWMLKFIRWYKEVSQGIKFGV